MKQILCFGDSNKKNVRIVEEGLCGETTVIEDEIRSGRKGIEVINILIESHYPLDRIMLKLVLLIENI